VEDFPEGLHDKPGTQYQQKGAEKKERSFPRKQPGNQRVGNPDRVGENGATALDEQLQRATAGRETGGENGPGFLGGVGKAGESVGWAGPKGGGEEQIAGFGGRADLSGQPVERGEGLDAAGEFAERIVIEATSQGEKRKESGLEGLKGAFLVGGIGDDFQLAGEGGGEGCGVEQVGGEEGDGFEGLAARLVGGEKRWERLEVEGLEDGLHPWRGVGLKGLAEAETDGFTKQEGENFRWGGHIFFKGEAGGGENLFQAWIPGAEPGEVAAGGEDGAGAGDGFCGAGKIHRLGEQGKPKAGAQVFGVEEGGGQFRQGGGAFAGA